jgi:hypothetical protein
MSVGVLSCIVFIIQLICFPACINIDIRRAYGRIFQTRIDTKIYHYVFYCCAIFICILFVMIQFGVII